MTEEGSGREYFGLDAEFFNPLNDEEIVEAIDRAWERGRLSDDATKKYQQITWELTAEATEFHYHRTIKKMIRNNI